MSRLFVPLFLILAGYLVFFSTTVELGQEANKVIKPSLATSSAEIIVTPSVKPISRFEIDNDQAVALTLPKNQIPQKNEVKVPILTYHYVGNNPNPKDKARDYLSVTPTNFDEQLGWLSQNGYTTITLDELYSSLTQSTSLPQKPVILSFDDGYVDFYYNAWPILQKYNFKAVSFIPTGLVGKDSYMTWEMIQTINNSRLVDFESHGVSHRNLTSLSTNEIKIELFESKKILEEKLSKKIQHFCYPYGSFNDAVIFEVKNAGYLTAVSTIKGSNHSSSTIYSLFRIKIDEAYIGTLFDQKINF